MIPKAFKEFITFLFRATESGDLRWHEGDYLAYYCERDEATVHVSRRTDRSSGHTLYHFTFSVAGRPTPFTVSDLEHEDFATMSSLFDAVVANAHEIGADLRRFVQTA